MIISVCSRVLSTTCIVSGRQAEITPLLYPRTRSCLSLITPVAFGSLSLSLRCSPSLVALTHPIRDAERQKIDESAMCVCFCSCILMLQLHKLSPAPTAGICWSPRPCVAQSSPLSCHLKAQSGVKAGLRWPFCMGQGPCAGSALRTRSAEP